MDRRMHIVSVLSSRRRFLVVVWVALVWLCSGVFGGQAGFGQNVSESKAQPVAAGQAPATILLIRHAEKLTDGRLDLSPVGFERAKRIPQLFGGADGTAPHSLPRPEFLFATHVSAKSNRPVETITPLSEAMKMPISSEVEDKEYAKLVKELMSGKYAGRVVLVAWHHGTLPQLAEALGATVPYKPWPETQFDRVWRIDYKDGKAALTDLPQGLFEGDSK